jgi:ssDNA-binding replication factor A large subunit
MEYSKIIEKIAFSSGMMEKEVEEKIEAKRTKLSGLISKEGAAQIVAAELGISFENEKSKINDLTEGMRRANLIGKITRINEVREFKTKDREGKVASFLLGDNTGNIRVALWDMNHISLIEGKELKEGDVVEISGANVRKGELHLSGFSDIKKSNEKLIDVKVESVLSDGNFIGVKDGDRVKVRAVIMQSFEPRYFDSKKNIGEKGVLFNIVLDDGTETMRAVLFNENIKKLIEIKDEDMFSLEKFNEKRESIIGEERIFSGIFRLNNYSQNVEMSINGVEEVNVDNLIKELESKV